MTWNRDGDTAQVYTFIITWYSRYGTMADAHTRCAHTRTLSHSHPLTHQDASGRTRSTPLQVTTRPLPLKTIGLRMPVWILF